MAITVSEFTPSSGTGTSLTVTKTLTAGSTVIVFASSTEGAAALTCSDGVNTYTEREAQTHGSSGIKSFMWTAPNVASGSTTVTLGGLAGYQGTLHAFEVLDADTTTPYEDSDYSIQSVTSVYHAQAAGITISAGGLALAVLSADRDIVGLSVSGYTAGTTVNTASIYAYPRWQVFAGGASGERAAGTLTSNGHTTGMLVAIKAAAGGGGSSAGAAAHYYRQMQ